MIMPVPMTVKRWRELCQGAEQEPDLDALELRAVVDAISEALKQEKKKKLMVH
jgi:hypothetical protein